MKYVLIPLVLFLIWIFGVLVALSAPMVFLMGNYKRCKNVFTCLDQLCNSAMDGDPDETISSRCGKRLQAGIDCFLCRHLCKVLDWGDDNHCIDAIDLGEGRNEIK